MASSSIESTWKYYLEAKIKFGYYLLGLTAAILGLSIKFLEPKDTDIFSFLVFVSWGAFVVSILAGIHWQRQWITMLLIRHTNTMGNKQDNEKEDKTEKLEKWEMRELDNTIHKGLSSSHETQVISFTIGLISIALFKIINFYY